MNEDVSFTLDVLRTAPQRITERIGILKDCRARLAEAKRASADLKVNLEQVTGGSTMAAYALGAITGKNQAERDLQIGADLQTDQDVCEAARLKREAELTETNLGLRLEALEGEVKAMVYQLQAAQSAAALHVALLGYEQAAQSAEPLKPDAQHVRQAQRDNAIPASMFETARDDLLR